MNLSEILKDSSSYPLSNWKSYLILGVILVITSLYWHVSPDEISIYIVPFASFLTEFLIIGYLIKIIKSTLECENVLPKYNGWLNIIIDGFKGSLIYIVYFIPLFILFIGIIIYTIAANLGSDSCFELFLLLNTIYAIIIIPIIALALANMALEGGRLLSAFRFGEILEDMYDIGWRNLLALYLLLGITYIIINNISNALAYLLVWIDPFLIKYTIAIIIKCLILIPYLYIFATRTFALIYRSSVVETSKSFGEGPSKTN